MREILKQNLDYKSFVWGFYSGAVTLICFTIILAAIG